MRDKTVILLLVFIGLVVYFNSLLNGFVKDDFIQIIDNVKVHSLANIPQIFAGSTNAAGGADKIAGIFYRPLMLSSYSLLYTLFGPAPFFFHFFQLIFHIANALLVYFFIKRFFKNITAFIIALLFLIHPINNEAVVYMANLQEILFFFFGMLALLLINKDKNTNIKTNIFILFLLFLSLLSKESGVLFLVITIIYNYFYGRRNFKFILFGNIIVFGFYLFLRYGFAKMYQAQESVAPISQASLIERVYHIPVIITYYLKTFFYPVQLGADQFWFIYKISWSNFFMPLTISILMVFLMFTGGIYFYKKKNKIFSNYLFFSLWFLVGLGLHLQLIKLDATVADRWFYFPIVGLLGIFALFIQNIKIKSKLIAKSGFALLILFICLLTFRTYQRNYDWVDEITLFEHDIHATPKNFILDNLYATALIRNEEFKKAKPYVESSIKEHPFYANLNNMAIIYASEKKYKQAKKYLQEAVNVSQNYAVYENYANFLLVYDDLNEAETFTKNALKMFPGNSNLWMILAKIQYFKGDKKDALKSAEKAHEILPRKVFEETLFEIKNNTLKNPARHNDAQVGE